MMEFSSYNKKLFIILFTGLALVASINFIIDPLDIFEAVKIPGINTEKTLKGDGGQRLGKGLDILKGDYQAVIMGTSRAYLGLDPQNPQFDPYQTYNLALPGTNIYETYNTFQFARTHLDLKVVVIGLDMIAFSDSRNVSGDYLLSPFSGRPVWQAQLKNLLSFDTLYLSWETVRNNLNGMESTFSNRGSRILSKKYARKPCNHRKLFITILSENFFISRKTYAGFSYGPDRLDLLAMMLEQCRQDGIELYSFISPIHARQMEAMRVMGLYPMFEQWERDLVDVYAEHNQAYREDNRYLLWDFSGYNSITTEYVPRSGQISMSMKYFWDSSHYKPAVGDIILSVIMGESEKPNKQHPDFGIIINKENIGEHIKEIRQGSRNYQKSHPFEIEQVEEIAVATRRFHHEKVELNLISTKYKPLNSQ